mmetsp:Transcript_31391/g.48691  ORF Transcript_31391/g.48691 Transcript_31391/m.48691 type:complete len:233 (-) Transcript_31391:992-1690(-)
MSHTVFNISQHFFKSSAGSPLAFNKILCGRFPTTDFCNSSTHICAVFTIKRQCFQGIIPKPSTIKPSSALLGSSFFFRVIGPQQSGYLSFFPSKIVILYFLRNFSLLIFWNHSISHCCASSSPLMVFISVISTILSPACMLHITKCRISKYISKLISSEYMGSLQLPILSLIWWLQTPHTIHALFDSVGLKESRASCIFFFVSGVKSFSCKYSGYSFFIYSSALSISFLYLV